MKIALLGYGRMGREIERLAGERGVAVAAVVDPLLAGGRSESGVPIAAAIAKEAMAGSEVALDFTRGDLVVGNVRACAGLGINVVEGTTGWNDVRDQVRAEAERGGIGIVWSANFSLGINLFHRVVRRAAALFDKVPEYDVYLREIHHRKKADSPSGTAIMLGETLLGELRRKRRLVTERLDRPIAEEEIHVSSTRGGTVPGTHVVGFDSPADTIEFIHTARNRSGFASGALAAVEFIRGRSGFYGIEALLDNLLGEER